MSTDRKVNILCIDDEPFILTLLSRILTLEGYRVLTASDQKSALEIVNKEEVDLVISDYLMPDLTGTELIKLINKKSPNSLKMILTGQADDNEIEKAINQGLIIKCLQKPISGVLLKSEIKNCLHAH
ncbi:MAG: response regulator [Bdellovibrionaceae bacterium]|nr:response regulator [Pseudobdellovibrionaceae bacterium]NUM60497.1 response regulator [Pseudobdellovibrionaceae bacterium]